MSDLSRQRNIAFGVLITVGVLLGLLAHVYTRFPGDLSISLVVQSVHSSLLLTVTKGLSYIFDHLRGMAVVVFLALIFWWRAGLLEGGTVLLSGLFTAVNEVFKLLVNRPRPTADLVQIYVVETEKSFPSGHAFFAAAVLGFIAYLIVMRQKTRTQKILIVSAFVFLILCVGFSRIYLGVHWASDVIGGYLAGSIFLLLEIWLYRFLKARFDMTNAEKFIVDKQK